MKLLVFFCHGIDTSSHLSRVDKASLPQQALMELFVDGMTNREIIWDGIKEEPKDIEEWEYVALNKNGEVIHIHWFRCGLEGTLNLEWLPSTVEEFKAHENKLTGSIHLETLPPSMRAMYLSYNKFSGEISLKKLPETLNEISLTHNQFIGTIDLTKLPESIKWISLSDNNFSGLTDFSQLPKSLHIFDVSNTQLEGEIYMEKKNDGFNVSNSNVKIVVDESQE